MSRFQNPYRLASHAQEPRPSHAFIALHRCVESLARLTGESFTSIFDRVAVQHGFSRLPENWPGAEQIRLASRQISRWRDEYLKNLSLLVAERRAQKKSGRRHFARTQLELLEQKRRLQNQAWPEVGNWGWRKHALNLTSGS